MRPLRWLPLALLAACQPPDAADLAVHSARQALAGGPEIPAIITDVHLTEGGLYSTAVLPPLRTSADGRVGLDMKGHGGDTGLYLLSPEKLSGAVTDPSAPPGVEIVASTWDVPDTELYDPTAYAVPVSPKHRTICDATPQFFGANTPRNPHPCDPTDPTYIDPAGSTHDQDCYTLTVVSSVPFVHAPGDKRMQLWSKRVTVVVEDPKRWDATAGYATIVDVDTSEAPVAGPISYADTLLEPMITQDGRLLVGRIAKAPKDPNTDASRLGDDLDIVYSVYDQTGDPCDVSRWTDFHPLSHAHYDPVMAPYGIAAYPLRDPTGAPIGDGVDLHVSYPWIDRDGDNLFFTALDTTLYNADLAAGGALMSRYGARCVVPGCTLPGSASDIGGFENLKNFRGHGVAGLWTRGKMVLLDNALNNIDYGLARADDRQVWLDLYAPGTNPAPGSAANLVDATGEVRIGTGRANGSPSPAPGETSNNSTFLDSFEHLFNHVDALRPLTVRDVVWTVTTGKSTAEVAFDDFLDPNALIVSSMAGALAHRGAGGYPLEYFDGFDQAAVGAVAGPLEVRFQNAASPVGWVPPAYGLAEGDVRLEPVALGGIVGKGAWLDGHEDAIAYTLAAQPQSFTERPWYLGLFLDPRFEDDGVRRQLVGFPDGSRIELVGRSIIAFVNPAGGLAGTQTIAGLGLPAGAWSHFGFLIDYPAGRTVVFVNGYPVGVVGALPGLGAGSLRIGDVPADAQGGVIGWIDEVKLLAHDPGFEVACNHARGTLMGVDSPASPWAATASLYPGVAHGVIDGVLAGLGRPTFPDGYVCFHDYTAPLRAHPSYAAGLDLTSIREDLIFPEGPLHWDVERPDSSGNAFCLSCHLPGDAAGLGLTALTAGAPGVLMRNDERRQPMMPPRVIFGNVPADHFDTGPATDLHTGSHGIDRYVFP